MDWGGVLLYQQPNAQLKILKVTQLTCLLQLHHPCGSKAHLANTKMVKKQTNTQKANKKLGMCLGQNASHLTQKPCESCPRCFEKEGLQSIFGTFPVEQDSPTLEWDVDIVGHVPLVNLFD